jgi:hypothetical protein
MIGQTEVSVPVPTCLSQIPHGLPGDRKGASLVTRRRLKPEQWHDSYCTSLESCLSECSFLHKSLLFLLSHFADYSQFCSDTVSVFWVSFPCLYITTDSSIAETYQISWVLPWRFKRQNLQSDENYCKAARFSNYISSDCLHMLHNMHLMSVIQIPDCICYYH